MNAERRHVGRRSKGPRHTFGVRVPQPVADTVMRVAKDRGVSYQDLVCSLICTAFGRPDLAVVPVTQASDPQGVLDFEERGSSTAP